MVNQLRNIIESAARDLAVDSAQAITDEIIGERLKLSRTRFWTERKEKWWDLVPHQVPGTPETRGVFTGEMALSPAVIERPDNETMVATRKGPTYHEFLWEAMVGRTNSGILLPIYNAKQDPVISRMFIEELGKTITEIKRKLRQ